jgi:hypothetical protein
VRAFVVALFWCTPEREIDQRFRQVVSELGVPGILIMSRSSAGRSPNGGRRIGSPSPPPRRPRYKDGGRVIERVVEKSTAGIVYPMLMRTNYTEWSVVMHVNLQAAGLWEAV